MIAVAIPPIATNTTTQMMMIIVVDDTAGNASGATDARRDAFWSDVEIRLKVSSVASKVVCSLEPSTIDLPDDVARVVVSCSVEDKESSTTVVICSTHKHILLCLVKRVQMRKSRIASGAAQKRMVLRGHARSCYRGSFLRQFSHIL